MGEAKKTALRVHFNRRLRLEFHGARITSDAGLLACRELDDALGLTVRAPAHLQEIRHGRNVQHELVPLLRQSVYSRLAGYEDTNDAERLARDPAMQAVVGRRALEKQAASTIRIRHSLPFWGMRVNHVRKGRAGNRRTV
jgi:hypothetical protein